MTAKLVFSINLIIVHDPYNILHPPNSSGELYYFISLIGYVVVLKCISQFWTASEYIPEISSTALNLRIPKTPSKSAIAFNVMASVIAGRAAKSVEVRKDHTRKK